ncbi:MAG TPA: tetratricopeptide repeat protein [Tepidisphaeraceae bacterium]|jgi:predicted O-linked N-acetylglucosamine transferase (SPINDLY family)
MQMTTQKSYEQAMQHLRAGRPADAEAAFQKVLGTDPRHLQSLLGLAQIFYQTGRPGPAVDALRKAAAIDPRNADLQSNLGTVLSATGQIDEAIAAFAQAISLAPNIGSFYSNLGNALQSRGQYEQAVEAYRRAIALQPMSADAHNNLGTAYIHLDRKDDAIPEFRQALTLRPSFAQAMNNLGTVLCEKGVLDEAIQCCKRALELDPDLLGVYRNLGNSYRDAGQLDEAIAAYRKASARKNEPAAMDDLFIALLLHPHLTREQVWNEHVIWNREYAMLLAPRQLAFANTPDPHRKIRVGYVSPDFSEHPVGRFFLPLIVNHDRSRFEIYCYDETRRPDLLTEEAKKHADVWRRTMALRDDQLARVITDDRIDVLVDLTMHTKRNRLLVFARKPAPVQTTFLAYPGTTGLTAMDYRITDPYLDPPDADQQFYSETSIRLPSSYWCYQPHRLAPPVNPLPAITRGEVTFGCLNLFGKMNAPVFELWTRILNAEPRSRIVIYCFEGSQRDRTIRFFAERGIDRSRIELVVRTSPAEYFLRYHQIDIALDTSPFPGGTTTCDSLWMGVPVVTLAGNTPLSRGGVSILSNVGIPELIAKSPDEYVQIASSLATDLPRLSAYRAGLRERMTTSPLMNPQQHARDMEAAYRQMWSRWCATASPLK